MYLLLLWLFLWAGPQPPSYQLFLWLYSYGVVLSIKVTSYSYGYSTWSSASKLPSILMAIPVGWSSASKLPAIPMAIFLWPYGLVFSLKTTSYSYGYSCGVASGPLWLHSVPRGASHSSGQHSHLAWSECCPSCFSRIPDRFGCIQPQGLGQGRAIARGSILT
jgi:hypothetical protein